MTNAYSLKRWYVVLMVLFFATFFILVIYGPRKNVIIPTVAKEEIRFQNMVKSERGDEDWLRIRTLREEGAKNFSNLGRILFLNDAIPPNNPDFRYKILVWKYGKTIENRHLKHFSDKEFDPFEKCSVKNCDITYNDSDLENADLVIIHLQRTKNKSDIPPKRGHVSQLWAFLTDESPYHTFLGCQCTLKDFNGIFNWAMTYRMDSDIPVPYGRTVPLKPNEEIEFKSIQEWEKSKRQDVLVAILGSNCGGVNHRWDYIKELEKYIKIDKYGRCGNLKCPGHYNMDCPLLSQYKFYLAFENANCDEYITEKVWWQSYAKNSIPIVMGTSRKICEKLLPPNSYLNVEEFASPKILADYILYLNSTYGAFEKFFKWKRKFKVVNEHGYFQTDSYHYCRACEALNYNEYDEPKVYNDLESFWSTKDCHPSWDAKYDK